MTFTLWRSVVIAAKTVEEKRSFQVPKRFFLFQKEKAKRFGKWLQRNGTTNMQLLPALLAMRTNCSHLVWKRRNMQMWMSVPSVYAWTFLRAENYFTSLLRAVQRKRQRNPLHVIAQMRNCLWFPHTTQAARDLFANSCTQKWKPPPTTMKEKNLSQVTVPFIVKSCIMKLFCPSKIGFFPTKANWTIGLYSGQFAQKQLFPQKWKPC